MKKIFGAILFISLIINAQNFKISKVEPPNWWANTGFSDVELMVYGENIDSCEVSVENNTLKIISVDGAESPNYLFVKLKIAGDAEPGNYKILFSKNDNQKSIDFPILKREFSPDVHKGFWPGDAIYLITPDRFSNGDTTNDFLEGQVDKFPVTDLNGRHGGDIQGIINHLDYIKNMGFSTIWITPMLENSMWMSYHGYAATDFYNIDKRFGTNELYKKLVETAHIMGLKVIMDHVTNHIGDNYSWMKDLPFKDWINGTKQNHLSTNHNKEALFDVHSDSLTQKINVEGWFEDYMPDLNQNNKHLSTYLIQNTIWWIEYSGIDGIREDTYPYAEREHMAKWAETLYREYKNFNILGEVWKGKPSLLAVNQNGNSLTKATDTKLHSITDFALLDAFKHYLSGKGDLYKVYETFAEDFLYPEPENLVTFLDNHDVARAGYLAKGNLDKVKLALTILLTSRGIPQIYYGTELGYVGIDHHGSIRSNFIGGFPNDERNAFKESGRNNLENDIYNYIKNLIKIRKKYKSLSIGEFTHYQPKDDFYYYFKKYKNELTLVINNSSSKKNEIKISEIRNNTSFKIKDLTEIFPEKKNKIEDRIIFNANSSKIYKVN